MTFTELFSQVPRGALQELRTIFENIRRNDETRFEHHQPRRFDGKLPEGGTRWLEPREIAVDATKAIDGILERPEPSPWQPIDSCPDDVLEALLFWPAFKLNDDGELTDERIEGRGLVGRATRISADHDWDEHEPELAANGFAFDDDWEFGAPTHWHPMPAGPRAERAK
jgi:hypothetical protein